MDGLYIQKVLHGDTDAFQYFVSQYKDFAFSVSYSILKHTHLAEEAVQESFVKAFKNLKSFKQESAFQTWFARIVINESLKIAKKGNHEMLSVDEIPDNQIKTIENTIKSLVRKEQKYYISAAFEQLASRESLALELFYLKEKSIREIKELTGWSESKIKMLLVRGRKNFYTRLKKMLKSERKEIL